jgi:hypothetical protein
MNALKRSYRAGWRAFESCIYAIDSITYEPVTARGFDLDAFWFDRESQTVHTRFISDNEWTTIFYYGETFSMKAHWLVAWFTFRIVRKFWKNRRIA